MLRLFLFCFAALSVISMRNAIAADEEAPEKPAPQEAGKPAQPPPPVSSTNIQSPEVKAWQGASVHPVAPASDRHSIHAYFNMCPESPDGKYVLYFSSTDKKGEKGDICILERATGKETTLASGIVTEDGHRVACQQWLDGGKKVVYHDFREGKTVVVCVDVATGQSKDLVEERLLGFGAPNTVWAPVYGYHWKQGAHRDIEFVNVETGEIRTVVKLTDVLEKYGTEVRKLVGEGEVSLFFPVVSPDGNRIMFKVAKGWGKDEFRTPQASTRQGKFVYDVSKKEFLKAYALWGHPAWTPDSNSIIEKGIVLEDVTKGTQKRYAVGSPSDHQSMSPDGKLYVADANISKRENGYPNEWGIIVGSLETNEFATIYRFKHADGASSWRPPHPHPNYSADGKRIYFNVSSDGWTRVYVAELPPTPPAK